MLLIDYGGKRCAQAIIRGMALGHVDHYLTMTAAGSGRPARSANSLTRRRSCTRTFRNGREDDRRDGGLTAIISVSSAV